MQRTGDAGFTMRALAEEAGVSVATPYNLFGSKQAVMLAVLDADIERAQQQLLALDVDELEVFFAAVSLATTFYAREPGFYRAMLLTAYAGGREYRSMFGGSRHAVWRGLVEAAVAAGWLRAEVEPNAFALHLGQTLFSCILEWVFEEITLEELEVRASSGFAIILLGMATPAAAERLRPRASALQQRLHELARRRAELPAAGSG